MPPFRSFFPKKTAPTYGVEPSNDENAKPPSTVTDKADLQTEKRSNALNIKGSREEPNEYKMSVVNDNGEYLPPSPPEKKSFWLRSSQSTTSSNHRSLLSENEPFSISRESFESYRRSFDISARSPVTQNDSLPSRTSLDSRSNRQFPRSAVNGSHFEKPQKTEEEEAFEDVGLNDDAKPKKKSLFSRFGDSTPETTSNENTKPAASHHFHLPGRKRGQSGVGAELGNIDRPASKGNGDGVIC